MKKSCPGLTLIEFLVVVSIITILSAMGISVYNQFNRRQILTQAVKNLKNDLRLAQSKAMAGEKPSGCTGTLSGYQVVFYSIPDPDRDTYKIFAICDSGSTPVGTYELPENVRFSPSGPPDPSPITFNVLTRGVSGAGSINLTAFSKTQVITVTDTGEIN